MKTLFFDFVCILNSSCAPFSLRRFCCTVVASLHLGVTLPEKSSFLTEATLPSKASFLITPFLFFSPRTPFLIF